MTSVSNVGADNSTQNTKKLNNNNNDNTTNKNSGSNDYGSIFDSAFSNAGSNLTEGILSGNFDIGKFFETLSGDMLESAVSSLFNKFKDMLLGGNDAADAAAGKAKNASNISKGAAIMTEMQEKLIGGSLDALQQLVTTGEMDLQTYANNLTNSMIEVGVQGAAAELLGEENKEREEENEDLLNQVQEKLDGQNISMEKDEEGNMVFKDESGNQVDMEKLGEGDDELKGLIEKMQDNNTIMEGNKLALQDNSETTQTMIDDVTQGIQGLVTGGQDLTTTVATTAANLLNDGMDKLTTEVINQVGKLKGDATTATTAAATDAASGAAAPEIATGILVASLGTASGQAATVTTNGGINASVGVATRTSTAATAGSGIIGSIATGKGVAQAINSTVKSTAKDWINNQIQANLVEPMTASLTDSTETETQNLEDRKNKYGIDADEKDKA